MLFSDSEIAGFINESFEPTWRSLRPVPKVSIDFGNGKVINRTLHGNIATFVCTADGTVVDVIAGIYTPEAYKKALAKALETAKTVPASAAERTEVLMAFHRQQQTTREAPTLSRTMMLAADTALNETERRERIHAKLAEMPNAKPDDIMKWLYRDVLHADLDDPYLGLKPTLFATYPFADETAKN